MLSKTDSTMKMSWAERTMYTLLCGSVLGVAADIGFELCHRTKGRFEVKDTWTDRAGLREKFQLHYVRVDGDTFINETKVQIQKGRTYDLTITGAGVFFNKEIVKAHVVENPSLEAPAP